MSPFERRRRRSKLKIILAIVIVLLIGSVLVGGIVKIRTASGPFHRDVNRSYALQADLVIAASNAEGTQFASLVGAMATMNRTTLQITLDTIVRATANESNDAASLAPPTPTGHLNAEFTAVIRERAKAVAEVCGAVDAYLGMAPLAVFGASASDGDSGRSSVESSCKTKDRSISDDGKPSITSTVAVGMITDAAALLAHADSAYASLRREFRTAPGHAALPISAWEAAPGELTATLVGTLVNSLSQSSSLAPVARIEIAPHALRMNPSLIPGGNSSGATPREALTPTSATTTATTPTATPGTTTSKPIVTPSTPGSVVPPTGHIQISVVVSNEGNVEVSGAELTAQLTPTGPGKAVTTTTRVTVFPSRSSVVSFPPLKVHPGGMYTLRVALVPPEFQSDLKDTSQTLTFSVADPTPPTTTTTTTTSRPPTTTTAGHRSGSTSSGSHGQG